MKTQINMIPKKYNLTVREGSVAFPNQKKYYTFTETELNNLKKDILKENYDGSYEMTNGDVIEIEVI